LFVYSQKEWESISEKVANLSMTDSNSRGFGRFFLSGAAAVALDKAGRVLIPETLKSFAGLGKDVVVTGVQRRVELWNANTWQKYKAKMEKDAELMAEKLGEVGVL
jgi:MraZ protein